MNYINNYILGAAIPKPDQCLICIEPFTPTDSISEINLCHHIFHQNCLAPWFEYNETCPICREDLAPKSDQYPSLLQYILLAVTLHSPRYVQQQEDPLDFQQTALSQTALTCCFLNILLNHYNAQEYKTIQGHIENIRATLEIDGIHISREVNLRSRTAAARELTYRIDLLRSQLLQWLWTANDPYHVHDPPRLDHGKKIFEHPYLVQWSRKISTIMGL